MLIACTSILSLFSSHLCFDQFIFTLCSLPYVHFHNSIYSSFSISLWFPENFGLFSCFSRLYVHFHLLGSVLPSGFRRFLDFFTAFLGFMSIFIGSAPYFSLASGEFWTFLLLFLSFISIWKSIEVSRLR